MVQSLPHSDRRRRYTVGGPSEVRELTTMLAPTFSQSEPTAVAVGLTPPSSRTSWPRSSHPRPRSA